MKEKIFYYSISLFIIGIFLSPKTINIELNYSFYLLLIISITIWLFLKWQNIIKPVFNIFLFSILSFSLGIFHYQNYYENKTSNYDKYLNQQLSQDFIVDAEPEQKGYKQKLIVKFSNDNNKAIIWTEKIPRYEYGDRIFVSGWLLKIKNFDEKFDYINFLKKENIFYEIKGAKIHLIDKHQNSFLKEKLYRFKNGLINQLKKLMPEPESSLLAGILIGAKEDMSKKLLEDFRKTGLIHIVVLSGYNLSILAEFLMIILVVFGRRFATIIGSTSIILFAIMTGASATIIRASIMALLIILAKRLGRNTEAIKLLFFAALIMLLFNPMLLLYDPSFQLSFLATLGLLLLSPHIEKIIKYGNWRFLNFREILAATLSAQIFVSPLILYMMGTFSLVAPLVNLLVIILIPISMFIGIITLIISFLWFDFSLLLSYLNYLILKYDLLIVKYFADFKYSIFEWDNFNSEWLITTYLLYFLIYILWKNKKKK